MLLCKCLLNFCLNSAAEKVAVFSDVITFFEYSLWAKFVLEAGIKEEKASLFKIEEGLI